MGLNLADKAMFLIGLFILQNLITPTSSFLSFSHWGKVSHNSRSLKSRLYGLKEWRKSPGSLPSNQTLLMLPFSLEDDPLLIPGQTQELVLKEGRFFDMLDEVWEDHGRILGGAIMGGDGLRSVVPLLEVTSYSVDAGYRGKVTTTVSLKCVGSAKLVALQQLQPIMRGICNDDDDDDADGDMTMEDVAKVEELVKTIEEMISAETKTTYEKLFWQALSALGYDATSLLTRDPEGENARREIQAASFAMVSLLSEPEVRYQAFSCRKSIERLEMIQQSLSRREMASASLNEKNAINTKRGGASNLYDDSGFE